MSARTRSALAAAVAALGLAVVVAPASAAGVLDQQQTVYNNASGIDGPGTSGTGFSVAETVTPGLTGGLNQVDLRLAKFATATGPLTIEIRNVVSPGVPGATVLASATVPAADVPVQTSLASFVFHAVPFAVPAPVVAGTQYAIVAYTGGSNHYGWAYQTVGDVYPLGRARGSFQSPPGTWLTFAIGVDFSFQSYVTSTYDFSGFFAPVNNAEVNTVKAGSSVPVKFSLGGDQGLDVLAGGYPKLEFTSCDPSDPVDPIEETTTANNGLTYDATTNTYTYVWKTSKSWSGKCGTFTLELNDATVHTADFQFK